MIDISAQLIFVLLSGMCFGSLVTLLSYRLPLEEDVVVKPSRCPKCETKLQARDLIPIFSWVALHGRCRNCLVPISLRYPLTELITTAVFLFLYYKFGLVPLSIVLAVTWAALMVMIVVDLEHYIIPDSVHFILIALGIAYHLIVDSPAEAVADGFIAGGVIGLLLRYGYRIIRKKEGMGLGDVKFLAVAGLWLGVKSLVPFLFFSGVLGIITGLIWKALKKGPIFPFAPALALSFFFCNVFPELCNLFWGIQEFHN